MLRSRLTRVVWLSLIFLSACAGNATPQPTSPSPAPATETPVAQTTVEDDAAAVGVNSDEAEESDAAAVEPESSGGGPEEETADGAKSETVTAPPGQPESVSMVAPDGLRLLGTFFPAAGVGPWPAVLLLHMLGSDREEWTSTGLPEALTEAGYAVLALDMRGHGDTGGEVDWTVAEEDLQEVWRYLARRGDVDPARIAVVGASIGANMAIRTGAREPAISTVVLLSPGLDYQGVTTADAMTTFADRPLLIVASSEDRYAAESSRTLAEQAGETAQLLMYDGAGHGTNMFRPQPDLIDVILDWLGENL